MEKTIIQQCVKGRMPLPETIRNAPQLCLGLEIFYLAFMDLSSSRGTGYGSEGPISWLSISDYCHVQGITGELREDVIYHVPRLDAVYLNFKAKKLKASEAP